MDLDKLKSDLEKDFDYFRITKAKTNIKYVNAKNQEVKTLNTDKYEGCSIFGVRKGKSAFVSTNASDDKDLIPKLKRLTKIGEKTDYLDLISTKKESKKITVGKKSNIHFEDKIKTIIKNSNNKNCSVNELIYVEREKSKQIITNYKNIEINSIYSVLQNNITDHEKDKIRNYRNRWGAQTNIDKKLETLDKFVNKNKKEANEQLH